VRPSYPKEAVDFVLEKAHLTTTTTSGGSGGKHRVLDLAAGTGKFTR